MKHITSHELARRLLEQPDLPLVIGQSTPHMGEVFLSRGVHFEVETVLGEKQEMVKAIYMDDIPV